MSRENDVSDSTQEELLNQFNNEKHIYRKFEIVKKISDHQILKNIALLRYFKSEDLDRSKFHHVQKLRRDVIKRLADENLSIKDLQEIFEFELNRKSLFEDENRLEYDILNNQGMCKFKGTPFMITLLEHDWIGAGFKLRSLELERNQELYVRLLNLYYSKYCKYGGRIKHQDQSFTYEEKAISKSVIQLLEGLFYRLSLGLIDPDLKKFLLRLDVTIEYNIELAHIILLQIMRNNHSRYSRDKTIDRYEDDEELFDIREIVREKFYTIYTEDGIRVRAGLCSSE